MQLQISFSGQQLQMGTKLLGPPNKLFIFLWKKKTCQNLVNDLATWGSFKKDIRILNKL